MGDALPTGTVTMLFSDMEGSTRLLTRLGPAYADILATQRQVQRAAYERWHGREMGTEGDSFFVVFASAGDALQACVEAQQTLAAHQWPADAQVQIRMGLHTGEPTRHGDGYVGLDVHLAARVAATAHGGQVVLSRATCGLVRQQLPAGATLRYLGDHRLKDIAETQALYQLMGPGLRTQFPALRSLGTSTNLPTRANPLIGRESELRDLTQMLARPGMRLHTLTGPGGSGKTRLALAVADAASSRYPDGVFFVPLASVTELDAMWSTMAEVVGMAGESKSPPSFVESIANNCMLLVLDNLEQLPEAGGPVVAQLLAAAPHLDVLVTSRRPLHLAGEQEYPVQPLPGAAAVHMFVQQVRLVRPDFTLDDTHRSAVTELCHRLDGLPLALEIVAARVKWLSPQALLDRLDSTLELSATSGRPDRQRTLRATMQWSYDLLPAEFQQSFRRLGVFAASADLDAVRAVTDVADPFPLLAQLVDASLVRVEDGPGGVPRVRLLQTMRRFALDQLAGSDDADAARRAQAQHYLVVAEALAADLRGPKVLSTRAALELELTNLREALGWCLADHDGAEDERLSMALQMCAALSWFWYTSGYVAEGLMWIQQATARAARQSGPEFATVLHTLGVLLLQQGESQHGRDVLAKCLRMWERIGDQNQVARELNSLGVAYRNLGNDTRARQLTEQSIAVARSIDDPLRLATALTNLGVLELDAGRPERAIEIALEAEAVDRARGDTWGVLTDQINRVGALAEAGRPDAGLVVLRDLAAEALALGDPDLTATVLELSAVCLGATGQPSRAARLIGAATSLRDQAQLPLAELDMAFYERHLSRARSSWRAEEWDADLEQGRGLSPAEAIELA